MTDLDRERLQSIRHFLLDLDGTTYLGEEPLPGSQRFFTLLTERNRRWLWLTNNSSQSPAGWTEKLNRLGFAATARDLYTSGDATVEFLHQQSAQPRIYLLGTPELRQSFTASGIELVADDPQFVVVGFDKTLTYEKLCRACAFIRQGVPFLATHPDINCPTPAGPIPDAGSFIALLKTSTGVAPRVIGKPEATMVQGALRRLGASAETTAMVGDRLETDIAMGRRAGLVTIAVLTGITTRQQVADSPHQPDYVFESLGELADALAGIW